MLKYKLIESSDNFVSYRYFPDGKEDYGEIKVSKTTKKIIQSKLAPNDEFRWYFLKMYKRIKEFIELGTFREDGMIAWY